MTYNSCVKKVMDELSALPPKWAEKLACNICGMVDTDDECDTSAPDCEDIRDCQTITSLTDFEVIGNVICISFTDEHGVVVKRCFEASQFTDEINETDGTCITPLWGILSATEKWQAIIDKVCNCCNPTTTTTTTSTTTTTTIAPCTDCWSFLMTNSDSISHDFSYLDCDDVNHNITLIAGSSLAFCACPDNITYDPAELILSVVDDSQCLPVPECETCNRYLLVNSDDFPAEIPYIDCYTLLPASIWVPANDSIITDCACTDSVSIPDRSGVTIEDTYDCLEITTSTTTTTTATPCKCYRIDNIGQVVERFVNYIDCNGDAQGEVVGNDPVYFCALLGSPVGFGITITDLGVCVANCPPTTTTTTTSTTTTTTAAPTTTTTTTTTSTTTTTTAVPEEEDIVYFTNHPTNGDRGAIIWFSPNDYYTPNTPASLIPANCLDISDLGAAPPITVTLDYWRDDVTGTIDDGGGLVRTADGTISVAIPADLLTYNGSSGAWQRALGIFTLDEGANIAAFEITNVTASYTYAGVTHNFNLPPANHRIRVHAGFLAGATGTIWFDLL